MANIPRVTLVPLISLLISVPFAQERAPNGQIYRELLPFVASGRTHRLTDRTGGERPQVGEWGA